jgi:hypothetical protein
MKIGDPRVSATKQNVGLRHNKPLLAFDASVDQTEARNRRALTTPNIAISRCLEADERPDRPATPEQV